MSRALIAAARDTGIRLTLLPVLYMRSGFDGAPLTERQRRFGHEVDAFLRLFESVAREAERHAARRHRVAQPARRAAGCDAQRAGGDALGAPIHIHIAEQVGEVADCLALRMRAPSNGCSPTPTSIATGRWCMRRT
jgi:formimidoylglutamate deiminase